MKSERTLKEILESLQWQINILRRASGIIANLNRHANAPLWDREGVGRALDPLYEKQAAAIEAVLGGPVVGGNVDMVLDLLRQLAWRCGAKLESAPIRAKQGPRWAVDESLFDAQQLRAFVRPTYAHKFIPEGLEWDEGGNLLRVDGKKYRPQPSDEDEE